MFRPVINPKNIIKIEEYLEFVKLNKSKYGKTKIVNYIIDKYKFDINEYFEFINKNK